MANFKKVGEITAGMAKGSPIVKRILEVINMPPKEKAKFHKDVKRDMQLGIYNSSRTGRKDYVEDKDVWFTYHKTGNKTTQERNECNHKWIVRDTDDGYTIMFDKKHKNIRPAGCKRCYDLKREKDGYEWLKLRREKKGDYKDVVFGDEDKPANSLTTGQEKAFIGKTEDGII